MATQGFGLIVWVVDNKMKHRTYCDQETMNQALGRMRTTVSPRMWSAYIISDGGELTVIKGEEEL